MPHAISQVHGTQAQTTPKHTDEIHVFYQLFTTIIYYRHHPLELRDYGDASADKPRAHRRNHSLLRPLRSRFYDCLLRRAFSEYVKLIFPPLEYLSLEYYLLR